MNIKYFFLGKNCVIDRSLNNLEPIYKFLETQNIFNCKVLLLNQIHGNQTIVIDESSKIYPNINLPKADAIVTNLPNIFIGVVTADCSPVLLFDKNKKIIAAAHAGWKGARYGIIESVIDDMKKLGATEISAIIGPMIHQKSYEISKDFFDNFIAEDLENKIFFKECDHNKNNDSNHFLFDLVGYVTKKIKTSGVKTINNVDIDTYSNSNDFFSFRRSNHLQEKDCGRNVSIIGNDILINIEI